MLQWSDKYSVGVEELDKQHQAIIELVREWSDRPDLSPDLPDFADLLERTLQTIVDHLEREEELLAQHGYPNLKSHEELHLKLLDTMSDSALKTACAKGAPPAEILACLSQDWWQQHILEEDMKYRAFFEIKGVR